MFNADKNQILILESQENNNKCNLFSLCQGHFHLINSYHYYIDYIWDLIASDIIVIYTLYQFNLYMV